MQNPHIDRLLANVINLCLNENPEMCDMQGFGKIIETKILV